MEKSTVVLQKNYKAKHMRKVGFIEALHLEEFPRIYFLKEQRHVFAKVLEQVYNLEYPT